MQLSVPTVRALPPVSLLQEGMVRRVRGVAHSMRVSPQSSNRMVRSACDLHQPLYNIGVPTVSSC